MFIDKEGNVRKPIVYLADFEMFLPSCPETVKYWKETCERYGLIGLFPGDGDPVEPGEDRWRRVFEHDVSYMKKSDMCIAQLDDWRGHEPDSGTLFELGYFVAKGLPSYGFYGGPGQMKERKIEAEERDGVLYDQNGFLIEDKGSAFDNMLALVPIAADFEGACRLARRDFDAQLAAAGYDPFPVGK